MARGIYRGESVWPAAPAQASGQGETLQALALIGEGLAQIGSALTRLGGDDGGSGLTRSSAGLAPGDLPWDGFDPGADEATTIAQFRTVIGGQLQTMRGIAEGLIDYEQNRPSPRTGVIRAAEDTLTSLDELRPHMWRQFP